ncbi:phosphate-starvation-inducible protein PsiE [Thiosulfativibrio zosterae]|uniref:Protein PsiE n=1 Tax=Thiosulfativibrio zosterae TaxID=2675053 RepID=A0A6F8PL05_9GAMM|nr:phosphate-starvation-inducible PsiE family protein [Thiosulfativibrio zosterae]BBP42680.1 phosphate starvation protein PhoH [Thiosulfativibrio zosterae]
MSNIHHYPAVKSVKRGIRIAEVIGLIFVALATIFAMIQEVYKVVSLMEVHLGDLLLMFIYLEILAMVAIYLDSGKLPIRFPMYIALIALARYLILDMKNLTEWQMLAIAVTMMIIALTVLIVRYGHLKLPYPDREQLEKNLAE